MISLNGPAGSRKKAHTKTVVTVFLLILAVMAVKYSPEAGAAVISFVTGR